MRKDNLLKKNIEENQTIHKIMYRY